MVELQEEGIDVSFVSSVPVPYNTSSERLLRTFTTDRVDKGRVTGVFNVHG